MLHLFQEYFLHIIKPVRMLEQERIFVNDECSFTSATKFNRALSNIAIFDRSCFKQVQAPVSK